MEKYRKIEWNKELKAMREPERLKNQRMKWQSISEEQNIFDNPKKNKETSEKIKLSKTEYKEKEPFYGSHKIFIPVFFAIIAAATLIGIWNKYLDYLEIKEIEKQVTIENERMKADLEIENKKIRNSGIESFKEIENRKKSLPKITKQAHCRPAKINGVWQNHCE